MHPRYMALVRDGMRPQWALLGQEEGAGGCSSILNGMLKTALLAHPFPLALRFTSTRGCSGQGSTNVRYCHSSGRAGKCAQRRSKSQLSLKTFHQQLGLQRKGQTGHVFPVCTYPSVLSAHVEEMGFWTANTICPARSRPLRRHALCSHRRKHRGKAVG